jgi:hypothetical protein
MINSTRIAKGGAGSSTVLPDGQIKRASGKSVSSPASKNIPLLPLLKSVLKIRRLVPPEGRLAIVTDAERDAMDARQRSANILRGRAVLTRTVKSCGPDAPTLASSLRIQFAGDGDKQARSPGRARRKPLKPLRGESRMDPVNLW